jgi:hypothetical protein
MIIVTDAFAITPLLILIGDGRVKQSLPPQTLREDRQNQLSSGLSCAREYRNLNYIKFITTWGYLTQTKFQVINLI